MMRFLKAYVRSMRLYFAFVTGIAGWIGVAFYDFMGESEVVPVRRMLILTMLFLSYGVNQVINDFFGLREDRINAPNRPMVIGELNPHIALIVSALLLAGVGIVSWRLGPLAVVPLVAGVLLNILYEYAKAFSLLGNAVFGLSIAMCTVYGFLAAGPPPAPLFTANRVSVVLLVAILNALMTYFTYFKDYQGDLAAGKRTFIVKYGVNAARYAGVIAALLPTLAFFLFMRMGWLPAKDILFMRDFVFCGVMTVFLQAWTAVLYFRHPIGERTYFSLVTNVRACVAGQVALIAIFNGTLALYLFSASYVLIGFLFDLYRDARS